MLLVGWCFVRVVFVCLFCVWFLWFLCCGFLLSVFCGGFLFVLGLFLIIISLVGLVCGGFNGFVVVAATAAAVLFVYLFIVLQFFLIVFAAL